MSWLLAMHMLYLIHWLLLITCEGGTILVLFLQMKKLRLWTVREPVQGHRVSEWQSWELDPRLQRPLSPLAHRPASPLGINKKPKAFMLIKHQVREALREGLIPQGAAVTEAGPRPWAENGKDSAQSREQGAVSNTNRGRLSGSGPRLCNEASNRVPGHWVMPETFNLNQTQIRFLRNEPRALRVLLLSRVVSNTLPWTPGIITQSSQETRVPASSPPPSPLTPPLLAAPQHWRCLLFLHSCYSVPWSFPTHANTPTHPCANTCTLICVHAQTCIHLSKLPSFKSQPACQENRKASVILFMWVWVASPYNNLIALCGFPLQLWPQFKLNVSLGKCLFNICLSHHAWAPWGQRPSALLTKHTVHTDMVPGSYWRIQGEKEVLYPF